MKILKVERVSVQIKYDDSLKKTLFATNILENFVVKKFYDEIYNKKIFITKFYDEKIKIPHKIYTSNISLQN